LAGRAGEGLGDAPTKEDPMAWWVWTLIAVAAAIALIALVAATVRARRSRLLRGRFGEEYQRTLDETGSRRHAEADLLERQERREQFDIRPLTAAARERYAEGWRLTQQQFVDTPEAAVRQADTLVTAVMRERGYPVDDFDRRADDVSVDHPRVVEDFREAQRIARASETGRATTEELRLAMVHFRSLFDEMLGDASDAADSPLSRDEGAAEPAETDGRIRTS
jgi:hypothetical protein